MSEKIEINTLITKHKNKCKNCRFEMIDVEDPLWEYGSPLKRVLIDNQTGETYDCVSRLVCLLNEQQSIISQLKEENEELRQILKDIVGATDETYTKNKNIYKVTVVFDDKMYNQIRRCLNDVE